MDQIAFRLAQVHERIAEIAANCGRDPNGIQLIAVSKRHPVDAIRAAHAAGQRVFGESYVQEAVAKIQATTDLSLEWHFIGRIQANKTRTIAAQFAWVHTLCDPHHAERLAAQRPTELAPLQCCIQVNLTGEASKGGVGPAEILPLASRIAGLPRLRLRGLMTMSAVSQSAQEQQALFTRLRQELERLQQAGHAVDTLSMGMTDDLEPAICAGATMVRVGTAIFGARPD